MMMAETEKLISFSEWRFVLVFSCTTISVYGIMSKNLMLKRDFPGPQGPRLPHLRVQRYNISANQQNNQQLFLKNNITIHYIHYINNRLQISRFWFMKWGLFKFFLQQYLPQPLESVTNNQNPIIKHYILFIWRYQRKSITSQPWMLLTGYGDCTTTDSAAWRWDERCGP